jgi:hypothetical protein
MSHFFSKKKHWILKKNERPHMSLILLYKMAVDFCTYLNKTKRPAHVAYFMAKIGVEFLVVFNHDPSTPLVTQLGYQTSSRAKYSRKNSLSEHGYES